MKARMVIWVSKPDNLPDWFKHDETIDVSESQIMELFQTGTNVMMLHTNVLGEAELMLAVDSKRFQQR
jgi:hypothetical protein